MAISNLRKAAVLLQSLSKEQAAALLGKLEPDQAAAVTAELGGLVDVDDAERDAVTQEFAQAGAQEVRQRQVVAHVPFEFLHDLDGHALLDLLAGEHPQTIALVLSCLSPTQAASVIAELTPSEQLSVVCRIATMTEPDPEVIQDVEHALHCRIFGSPRRSASHCGVASVIRMLNVMEPATERKLLGDLGEAAPELVREIRRVMFGVDVPVYGPGDLSKAAS
jgi:flagellar motor switch protein FliG